MWVYLRNRLNTVELANEDKRKGSRMQYLTPDQVKGYTVHRKISEGGFGEVYLATETRPNFEREVVLKRILPKFGNDPRFIQRFESEARTIARLEYPYIVPLYDYWRNPDGAYLVMRWLKGGSVKDRLESGPLDLETSVRIVNHVCSALALSHRNGVIHRDVKPGNILLDEEGNAFLSDFGIAKDFMKFDSNTQPEDIIGSPKYISPEQARNDPVTPRTDVYSLGVTLYEMLAGEHPFPNANMYDLIYKHLNEPLPLLTSLDAAVQDDINVVIQQATEKNPANRYEHAIDFARAFQAAAQLETTTRTENIEQQLTIREQQTLCLLMKGMTNKEIAAGLFVEHDTVRWHLRNAYKKLGVSRREQAIVVARTLNLVCEDGTVLSDGGTSYVIEFEPENPYKGLEAFSYADASNFYGREKVVEKLLMRLEQDHPHNRFLAVLGPSGSGKSSLVKAGLVPARWESESGDDGKWLVTDMFPSEHPVDELDIALRRVAARHADGLSDLLTHNERGLVKAAQLILPDNQDEILLIIDQFEEVFTQVESEEERVHFLNLITNAVMDRASRMRIVITIRADYFDRPLYYPQFGDILRDRVETVLPLSAEELEQAIVQPARKVGVKFEDGLVASIVSDIHYQPGALPLLQYALTELFDRRDGRKITREGYEQIGGAAGAIASTAEELFQSYDETGHETIRQMFLRLVTLGEGAEDTRRRTARDELLSIADDSYLMDEIIDTFAYARMLSLDNDPTTREPTVEVAHEAILREWERLRGWLNDSRDDIKTQRQLAALSSEWEKHTRSNDYLVRGTRLDQLQLWSSETSLTLTPSEQAFLDASIAERELREAKEQAQAEREANLQLRARRILQGLVAVFLVAAVISGGLAFEADSQRNKAEEARIEAEQERDTETSRRLAADSKDMTEIGNPELGVLLALEALEEYPFTSQAQDALIQAVDAYRPFFSLNALDALGTVIYDAKWSPDGTEVAGSGGGRAGDHDVVIWDVATRTERILLAQDDDVKCSDFIGILSWSPSGQQIAGLDEFEGCTVMIWDTIEGEIVRILSDYDSRATAVEWSPPNGDILATGHEDGTVIFWNAENGEPLERVKEHTDRVNDVAWSSDGRLMASSSFDGTVILWDTESFTPIRTLSGHVGPVRSSDWSPDGTNLVTGGDDGVPRVWDATTGETLFLLRGHEYVINRVDWSSDGRLIASSSRRGAIQKIWNAANGTFLFEIRGTTNGYGYFSPDTSQFLTRTESEYGSVQVWDIEQITPRLVGHDLDVYYANWSPDGSGIASIGRNDGVRLWDARTGQLLNYYEFTVGGNVAGDWSPDGMQFLLPVATYGGPIKLVEMETGEFVDLFFPEHLYPVSADWSPDGNYIAGSLFNPGDIDDGLRPVYVWDAHTHEVVWIFEPDDNCMQVFAEFSPDSSKVLAACFWFDDEYRPRSFRVWDITTGELVTQRESEHGSIFHATWSPDGHRIIATSPGVAEVWDVQTGEVLLTFAGHGDARVDGVNWHPGGIYVVTGDDEGVVNVWNSETGEIVSSFQVDGQVQNTHWSPDGTHIILGGIGFTEPIIKRVWLSTNELIAKAKDCCVPPGRALTPSEREQFDLPERE